MQVEAADARRQALHEPGMVDDPELVAALGVAGVVPVGEGGALELAQQLGHLVLVRAAVRRGKVLEAEQDAELRELREEDPERGAERLEMLRRPALALRLEAEDPLLVGEGPLGADAVLHERVEAARGAEDGDAPRVQHHRAHAELGGEARGVEDGLDAVAAAAEVRRVADRERLRAGAAPRLRVRAERVDRGDPDPPVAKAAPHAVGLPERERVAELDRVEAERFDLVEHRFAGFVAAGVPAGGEGEAHGAETTTPLRRPQPLPAGRRFGRLAGMSRRHPSTFKPMLDMNLTAMSDLTFLLLITFIITFPMIEQGLPVKLPDGKTQEIDAEEKASTVTIDREGRISLGETAITFDGLAQQLSARLVSNPSLTLVVRADEEAKHGDVMAVKLLARKLGVPKILEATSGQEAAR